MDKTRRGRGLFLCWVSVVVGKYSPGAGLLGRETFSALFRKRGVSGGFCKGVAPLPLGSVVMPWCPGVCFLLMRLSSYFWCAVVESAVSEAGFAGSCA